MPSVEIGNTSFRVFTEFVRFNNDLFTQPNFLKGAECRESHKQYVLTYYRKLFGRNINPFSSRHFKWYRRLEPLFFLPKRSSILDFGGGYGMDTLFLSLLGYNAVLYEIDSHHIGIAKWFTDRFREHFGPLTIDFVLSGKDPVPTDVDAVLLKEVAHHVEPARFCFSTAADMLRFGGHLFLLEPNFWCPLVQATFIRSRGFRTVIKKINEDTGEEYEYGNEHIRPIRIWNSYASDYGFILNQARFIIPWFLHGEKPSKLRQNIENSPFVRNILASHVALDYLKIKGDAE